MKFEKSPPWLVELFAEFTPALGGEPRRMFGYPSIFVGGNLATGLFQTQWMVRLSPADREELLRMDGAGPFDPMGGKPMKEYAVLPRDVLDDAPALRQWLDRCVNYVRTLPPKAGKKPAKAANDRNHPRRAARTRR